MQHQVEVARQRGYRQSKLLVGATHQATADLEVAGRQTRLDDAQHDNWLPTNLQTLQTTLVSTLQHYRTQIRYRLRRTT